MTALNGDAPILLSDSTQLDRTLTLDWQQDGDDRVYLGAAWSWEGNVFTLAVGIHYGNEHLGKAAYEQLHAMIDTVEFEPL